MSTGHLGTFVAGTNALIGNVIDITPGEESVGAIAQPYLALAKGSGMPYEPTELVEGGEYQVTIEDLGQAHYVDSASGLTGAGVSKSLRHVQTMTWTKPAPAGLTNGATRAFSGFVMSHQESPQKTGERNTITLKVKVAGTVTKTVAT